MLKSSKATLSAPPNYGGYISPSETSTITSFIEVTQSFLRGCGTSVNMQSHSGQCKCVVHYTRNASATPVSSGSEQSMWTLRSVTCLSTIQVKKMCLLKYVKNSSGAGVTICRHSSRLEAGGHVIQLQWRHADRKKVDVGQNQRLSLASSIAWRLTGHDCSCIYFHDYTHI